MIYPYYYRGYLYLENSSGRRYRTNLDLERYEAVSVLPNPDPVVIKSEIFQYDGVVITSSKGFSYEPISSISMSDWMVGESRGRSVLLSSYQNLLVFVKNKCSWICDPSIQMSCNTETRLVATPDKIFTYDGWAFQEYDIQKHLEGFNLERIRRIHDS